MMIICDAILTAIFIKMFAMDIATGLVACLFVLCMITFLRMSMKFSLFIDTIYKAAEMAYGEEKEKNKEME